MLKYFLILVGMCVSFPLYAMEAEDDEINVVIFSQDEDTDKDKLNLPTCDEQAMLDMVADQIREYQANYPSTGIINRRKQILMLKELKNFEEVDLAQFDKRSNHEVARRILRNKINLEIPEEKMRLCRSHADVYLLMYPEGNGYRVQIVNFVNLRHLEDEFSLFYTRPEVQEIAEPEDAEEAAEAEKVEESEKTEEAKTEEKTVSQAEK